MQYSKNIYMTGIFCSLLEHFSCISFPSFLVRKFIFALHVFELTVTSQECNISINHKADVEWND